MPDERLDPLHDVELAAGQQQGHTWMPLADEAKRLDEHAVILVSPAVGGIEDEVLIDPELEAHRVEKAMDLRGG